MRRRMIDPAFWNDSKIIALSIPARLLYIGLWNYADDDGFFLDDLPAIKRTLFPDQKFDIHGVFSECSCFLKRHQYKDEGAFAWEIAHFSEWQTINRPTPGKIKPFCELTEDSLNSHGALTLKLSKVKLSKVKVREEKRPAPAVPFVLPEWIKIEVWGAFEEMRNRIRHPMTDRAKDLIVKQLEKLRGLRHDPNECLECSIRNGWRDVFPPKEMANGKFNDEQEQHRARMIAMATRGL